MRVAIVNEQACKFALQILASRDIVIFKAGDTNPFLDGFAKENTLAVQQIVASILDEAAGRRRVLKIKPHHSLSNKLNG